MHIISIPIAIVAGLALLVLCFPVFWRAVRKRKRPQFSLGRLVLMMLAAAVLLFAGVRWLRVDRYLAMAGPWMAEQIAPKNSHAGKWSGATATHRPGLPEENELLVLNYALRSLPTRREQVAALKTVCELRPNDAYDMLWQHAHEDGDVEIKAIELRLIGLFRREDSVGFLMDCLRAPQAEVRAAAADALGIIHQPAYQVPIGTDYFGITPASISSDPLISLEKLSKIISPKGNRSDFYAESIPIALAKEVRDALENAMLRGATIEEREAAARSLLKWPPEKYQLRLMEWGVWIDDNGELKLLQSVLDEIPAFVHRTGNSISSLDDRVNHIIFFSKPVIQITTSVPMAIDLEVQIKRGRPWFAYPMPDDFGASVTMLRSNGGNMPMQRQFLSGLENADLASLENIREGYPWLSPKHRVFGNESAGPRAFADQSDVRNEICSLGLHWQSLIVSPQQLDWMQMPDCGTDAKFKWWSDLRSVPCSWISSRGESEKFLYYDGPTMARTPVKITRKEDTLTFTHQAMFPKPPNDDWQIDSDKKIFDVMPAPENVRSKPRRGMFLHSTWEYNSTTGEFSNKHEQHSFTITLPDQDGIMAMPTLKQISSEECKEEFIAMLTDQGMTREEARGMADCWSYTLFERRGSRFIYLLRPEEYYEMCPIQVRPAPTEMVRVGIVLTEF